MKFSDLDLKKLTDNDMYDLVMSGIVDYAGEEPLPENNPDFLIVLGCSPVPLKARVVKMMQLYQKGYGEYVLLSGGNGWHKLFKVENKAFKNEGEKYAYLQLKAKKYKEMKLALKHTIFDGMQQTEVSGKKGKALYKYMGKRLKQALNETEAQIAYKIMKASQDVVSIPDDKMFLEKDSMNTVQNLQYSRKLLDELQEEGKVHKVKKIMVITSSFHCRRAILSFKKYFPDAEVMACPSTLDLKNRGLEIDRNSLMADRYYMQQFKNEASAIVNYTKNGSIADGEIEDVISDKAVLERIKRHQEMEMEI
ncbi:MAG: YdcF family protein [Clostridia bacterium]|nr:YdcF family protein [Clostridia bacterium]